MAFVHYRLQVLLKYEFQMFIYIFILLSPIIQNEHHFLDVCKLCERKRKNSNTKHFFVDNMNNGARVYTCVYTQSHTRAIRAFCCVAANSVIKNLHNHRMYYGVNVKC